MTATHKHSIKSFLRSWLTAYTKEIALGTDSLCPVLRSFARRVTWQTQILKTKWLVDK